jgi:hypothetical protein
MMDIIITIELTSGTVNSAETIDFSLIEMPYGAKGYRFNGSSTASETDLGKYWDLVDQLLTQNGATSDNYVTLVSLVPQVSQ